MLLSLLEMQSAAKLSNAPFYVPQWYTFPPGAD
jgi:hypothetical protein